MEDPTGSWVTKSEVMLEESSPLEYTSGSVTTKEITKVKYIKDIFNNKKEDFHKHLKFFLYFWGHPKY